MDTHLMNIQRTIHFTTHTNGCKVSHSVTWLVYSKVLGKITVMLEAEKTNRPRRAAAADG
jgi:hypothetical protein